MNSKISIGCDKRSKKKPWVCRWSGEYNPDTGKSKRYAKGFKLKVDAENFAAQKTVEFSHGGRRDEPKDISIGRFCADWLRDQKVQLRPASLEGYQNTIRRLEDFFGKDSSLQDIDSKQARRFICEQKIRTIGHEGKELEDASREQIKRQCKTIFGTAVEDGDLLANPFKKIKAKKLTPKRWHRVTVKQYFALLDAASSLRQKVAYALLYTSGARMGEAFNLTWSDIDFENGKLIIANREGTADTPPFYIKDHEARRIPLPKHTIDLLAEWQAQAPEGVPYILLTRERYERVKAKWQRLCKEGKPWQNRFIINNVLRNFKVHCKRAGIKPVGKLTIHTLRKCAAQNWADNLPMNVVKELMGHSDIATTQRYYNQVDADHEAKAARVIDEMLKTSDVNLTFLPISAKNGDDSDV